MSMVGCGGEIVETALDGGDADAFVAESCIPDGAIVNGHSEVFTFAADILACDFPGPDYVSLNPNGYEAYWGAPDHVVFSCKSASYHDGCRVTYADCSGWIGDSGAGCNITSTELTFGAYGNGSVAHGTTSWSCSSQCMTGTGSDVTYLYPYP